MKILTVFHSKNNKLTPVEFYIGYLNQKHYYYFRITSNTWIKHNKKFIDRLTVNPKVLEYE